VSIAKSPHWIEHKEDAHLLRRHYGAPAAINRAGAAIVALADRPRGPSSSTLNLKIEVLAGHGRADGGLPISSLCAARAAGAALSGSSFQSYLLWFHETPPSPEWCMVCYEFSVPFFLKKG
jgi:hypothetical protein